MDRPVLQSGRHEAKTGDFRYKAFISYSWADAKWGKWLQQAIETYRTPKKLIGTDAKHGPVPARLNPLFKDREEEAAGASIGAAVEAALADSEFLIVICSPNSAKSQWVDRELAWFKTHRDPDKVLALIVDGEPGDAQRECFPKALTHIIAPDMAITDAAQDAPLAADARESGDGKRIAKLKIAAAMLGVGLDELVRRDERRRTIRTRIITTASLALAAVMSTLTWFAVEARKEAEFQRNEADGLVEFMLTDLREKLEPVGRLDALDVVGDRALDYYAAQKLGDLDADALGRRSRALLLVGEISNIRGDSEEALTAFTQAAATTKEQLARDPDNEQRIFDHAQSVFWVGYMAYSRGELDNAEAQFREYKRMADRLIELDPDNPDWQMESSYAEGNLGTMLYTEARFREAKPFFERAAGAAERAFPIEQADDGQKIELGTAVNWVGLVNQKLGDGEGAQRIFEREIRIYDSVLASDPGNTQASSRKAVALQLLHTVHMNAGELEAAQSTIDEANAIIASSRAIEDENTQWGEGQVRGLLGRSALHLAREQYALAANDIEQAGRILDVLIRSDASNEDWTVELKAFHLVQRSALALARDDPQRALEAAQSVIGITSALKEAPQSALNSLTRAHMLAGDAHAELGRSSDARHNWLQGLQIAQTPAATGVADHGRYLLLIRLGRDAEAQQIAIELDARNYRHPAYLEGKSKR